MVGEGFPPASHSRTRLEEIGSVSSEGGTTRILRSGGRIPAATTLSWEIGNFQQFITCKYMDERKRRNTRKEHVRDGDKKWCMVNQHALIAFITLLNFKRVEECHEVAITWRCQGSDKVKSSDWYAKWWRMNESNLPIECECDEGMRQNPWEEVYFESRDRVEPLQRRDTPTG